MASSEAAMTGRTGQLIAGAKAVARAAAGPQGAAGTGTAGAAAQLRQLCGVVTSLFMQLASTQLWQQTAVAWLLPPIASLLKPS